MRLTTVLIFVSGLGVGLLRSAPVAHPAVSHAAVTHPAGVYPPSTLPEETPSAEGADVEKMLNDFATDFRTDPMAEGIIFGIEVRDAEQARWHVYVGDREDGESECPVEVVSGFPPDPIPYFTTDLATLTKIHSGELASLTAMGKAFSTDFAPMDLEMMPGFKADESVEKALMSASFHFWTRGFPERIRFSDLSGTRTLHGANGVLFYYQEGFRSGYIHLQPGQHANADTLSQTNSFPTLLVITKGELQARIGQTECVLAEGEAVFIGPDVHHEFWIDESSKEAAEVVLLMFGEGA